MPDKATPSSADKSPSKKVAAIKAAIHKVVKRSPGREGGEAPSAGEASRPVGEGGPTAGRPTADASRGVAPEPQPAGKAAAKTSAKPAKEVSSKVSASKAGQGAASKAEPAVSKRTETAASKKAETAVSKKAEEATSKKAEMAASKKAETAVSKRAETAASKKPEEATSKKAEAAVSKQADEATSKKAETAASKKAETAASKKAPAGSKKAEPPDGGARPGEDKADPAKAEPSADRSAFLESQRQLLLEERQTYTSQAEALKNEADSLALEHEPGDVQFDEEGGEGGTANVDREIDLYLSAQARATVAEIDRALRKIDEGTYGVCESCGQQIPEARLQALPYATLCVNCKSGGLSSRR